MQGIPKQGGEHAHKKAASTDVSERFKKRFSNAILVLSLPALLAAGATMVIFENSGAKPTLELHLAERVERLRYAQTKIASAQAQAAIDESSDIVAETSTEVAGEDVSDAQVDVATR